MGIFKKKSHIQVRYNTKAKDSHLVWRVIIDGQEYLASAIEIDGYCYGEVSYVNNEKKLNIACYGYVEWQGTGVKIKASRMFNYSV